MRRRRSTRGAHEHRPGLRLLVLPVVLLIGFAVVHFFFQEPSTIPETGQEPPSSVVEDSGQTSETQQTTVETDEVAEEEEPEEIKQVAQPMAMNMEQIKAGDFSSLQGAWVATGRQIEINGDILKMDGYSYQLSVGGYNTTDGNPYLQMTSLDGGLAIGMPAIGLFPAGSAISIALEDGGIDSSGEHDPTDKTQDRMLMTQSVLDAASTKEYTLYRVSE
jgi:hypothetical protein